MASIYGETGKNSFRLRLDYEVTGQSISDNTSTVHMALYLYANTTGTYNNDGDAYWTIYGERTYYTFSYTSVGWYKLGERTVTIGHDAKGEKTVTLSGEWCSAISGGWAPYSLSVSGSVTLPTIPRKAEITSAPDFTDVDDPTVYYNNPAGTAASSVEVCISLTGAKDDVPYRAMDRSGGSYTFSLTDGERATLRNATGNSRTVSFVVRTVLGGTTYYASAAKTFTVTSNSATIPAESIAVSPESELSAPFKSLYIQGKTKASIKHTASGRFGASIQQYRAAVDGKTYDGQSAVSDYLKTAGDLTVTGTATDSRGFSGSSQQTITVLPYASPAVVPRSSLGAIVCGRCLSDGTLDSSGTSLRLRCARQYASVNENNKCTLRLRYKPEGGSYSGWVTLLAESDSGDDYDGVVAGVTLPVSTAYTIEVQAADKLGETGTAQVRIPTAEMTLHLGEGGTSAAFGRYAVEGSEKRLDVAWNAYFEKNASVGGSLTVGGKTLVDLIYPVGSVYISFNDKADPSVLFGGTWERINNRFLWAADAEGTMGVTGGEKETTLSASELPKFAGTLNMRANTQDSNNVDVIADTGANMSLKKNDYVWWGILNAGGDNSQIKNWQLSFDNGGQGKAHNNMPPFIQVAMWKRTA